jgi:hypothetical protein
MAVEALGDVSGLPPVDVAESTVRGGKPHAKLTPSPSLLFAILVRRSTCQCIVHRTCCRLLLRGYRMPPAVQRSRDEGFKAGPTAAAAHGQLPHICLECCMSQCMYAAVSQHARLSGTRPASHHQHACHVTHLLHTHALPLHNTSWHSILLLDSALTLPPKKQQNLQPPTTNPHTPTPPQAEEDNSKRLEKLRRASLDKPAALRENHGRAPQTKGYQLGIPPSQPASNSGEIAAVQGEQPLLGLPACLPACRLPSAPAYPRWPA